MTNFSNLINQKNDKSIFPRVGIHMQPLYDNT